MFPIKRNTLVIRNFKLTINQPVFKNLKSTNSTKSNSIVTVMRLIIISLTIQSNAIEVSRSSSAAIKSVADYFLFNRSDHNEQD